MLEEVSEVRIFDISNDNAGEKAARRRTKVPVSVNPGAGWVDPKGGLKSVVDGQRVNIPVLVVTAMGDGEI